MTRSDPGADGATARPDPPPDEYAVPPGAEPARCRHCGAPFPDAETLALHRGLDHADAVDEREREAFAEAYAAESDRLRSFQLWALAALVALYFGFLFAFALFA